MGFFSFFTNRKEKHEEILLAMPIYVAGDRYDFNLLTEDIKGYWKVDITDIEGDSESGSFKMHGETVGIYFVPGSIPDEDLRNTAKYAYNWPKVLDESAAFTGHAVVALMPGSSDALLRHKVLTKVVYSVLKTSDAVGVYKGNHSLLLPRKQYLESAPLLLNNGLPVDLWVYIGLQQSRGASSSYTYGLYLFGKKEFEILNSKMELEEMYNCLYNLCAYAIGNDIAIAGGQSIGYTADQKIRVTLSRGQFVKGRSLKLEM